MENSRKLIHLAKEDNILIACSPLQKDEALSFQESDFTVLDSIDLGHKLAATDIRQGEKILKLNVVIGSATSDIKKGQHVHLHNMKSDFIPTYTIENN